MVKRAKSELANSINGPFPSSLLTIRYSPFFLWCLRESDETTPRKLRTSCSVGSARAKRLRRLRIMPASACRS